MSIMNKVSTSVNPFPFMFKAAKDEAEKKAATKTLRDKQTILQPAKAAKPKAAKPKAAPKTDEVAKAEAKAAELKAFAKDAARAADEAWCDAKSTVQFKAHEDVPGVSEYIASAEAASKEAKAKAIAARRAQKKLEAELRENALPSRKERVEECAANVKALLFSVKKETALEVAEVLADMKFDQLNGLTADELTKIKGIGFKYAALILENRWELAGWTLISRYEVEHAEKPVYRKERQVSFNQVWNRKKDAKSAILLRQDIMRPQSVLDEHMMKLGYDPYDIFITLVGYVKEKAGEKDRVAEQEKIWKMFCESGFRDKSGKRFEILFNGTNGANKCMVVAVREDVADEVWKFCTNEARWDALTTEAKMAAYMGLCRPGTISLKSYIGFDVEPEEIAIIPEWVKVFPKQQVDFVDVTTGEVELDKTRDVKQNMFDGAAFLHFSDKKLKEKLAAKTPEQKKTSLQRLAEARPCSMRGPLLKPFMDPTGDIHAVLRKFGVTTIMTLDGEKDIDDVVLFIDKNVLKASIGPNGQFHSYKEYCEKWHRNGHELRVLIQEHPDRPKNLPFQQLQSMVGDDKEALAELICAELKKLTSYREVNQAVKLIGGELGRIVKACPGLLRNPWIEQRIQQAYTKLRNEAMGAKLHDIAHYLFLGVDPIAFCQHIAWSCSNMSKELQAKYPNQADYVVGAIAANEVVCAVGEKEDSDVAIMSRNPSTDAQAQCEVKVRIDFGEWSWAVRKSNTCYTSVMDYNVTRIRGDFDGDHVFLCFVKAIIAMVRAAIRITGGRLIDWDAPSTKKHVVTRESMKSHFITLTQKGQLGNFADMLTSLVGYGLKAYDHCVACWLVMAVNVFVDAGKHGMDEFNIPDFVIECLALRDENGEVLRNAYGYPVLRPMPVYSMQAKDNQHPSWPVKKVGSDRCAKHTSGGNGDALLVKVKNEVPATLDINLDDVAAFDVVDLMYDPDVSYRGLASLFDKGEYNPDLEIYEGQGLWKELVFERGRELKALRETFLAENEDDEDASIMYIAAQKSMNLFKRSAGIMRLTTWAEMNGTTIEDVYDVVTFYTFCVLKYPKAPTRGADESNDSWDARMQAYETRVGVYKAHISAWTDILGGLALRAIYTADATKAERAAAEVEAYEDIMADLIG